MQVNFYFTIAGVCKKRAWSEERIRKAEEDAGTGEKGSGEDRKEGY